MKKIIKLSFVFSLLFVFAKAQAQVIESVSFTPAKTGNYSTIATKSVTSFAGDLSVARRIWAHGYKLNFDTGENLPFYYNSATDSTTKLGAARDVYFLSTAGSAPVLKAQIGTSGKLYTKNDATIKNAKANVVYGGDVDFQEVGAILRSDAILNIADVKMNNPKCNIKWAKLPAYKTSEDYSASGNTASPNPSDYWFAYCETPSGCPNPTPYLCGGICQVCPCGQVNYGTDENPSCDARWQATTTLTKLKFRCTQGWDGSAESYGSPDGSNNSCYFTERGGVYGSISKSSFYCSNFTARKCTGDTKTYNMFQSIADSNTPYSSNYIMNYSGPASSSVWCAGSYTNLKVGTPPWIPVFYAPADGYYEDFVYPISSFSLGKDCSNPPQYITAGAAVQLKLRTLMDVTNKMFCGFQLISSYNTYARDVITNIKSARTCQTGSSISLCYKLAGVDLGTWESQWKDLSNEHLCYKINYYNSDVGDEFSCVKEWPNPTSYKAIRTRVLDTDDREILNTRTCDGACLTKSGDLYCTSLKTILYARYKKFEVSGKEDFTQTPYSCASNLYNFSQSDNYQLENTNNTRYLNKVENKQVLNCSKY